MKFYVAFPKEKIGYAPAKSYLTSNGMSVNGGNEMGFEVDWQDDLMRAWMIECEASIFKFIELCFVNKVKPIKIKARDSLVVPMVPVR